MTKEEFIAKYKDGLRSLLRAQDQKEVEEYIEKRAKEMEAVYDFYTENGMSPEQKINGDIYNDYMEF